MPGLLSAVAFTPGSLAHECAVHLINFTLWPLVGYALFKLARNQPQRGFEPQPPGRR